MTTAECRNRLYRQLEDGSPFDEVESWIDELPISDDAKAGLWLLAWAEQDRSEQRRVAAGALEVVDA